MKELIDSLKRYSEQCLTERLDADFARAVQTAIIELKAACEWQQLALTYLDRILKAEAALMVQTPEEVISRKKGTKQ